MRPCTMSSRRTSANASPNIYDLRSKQEAVGRWLRRSRMCGARDETGDRRSLDLADELLGRVAAFRADLARLALVPVREDAQQQVRAGGPIVDALDDDRRAPARFEAVAHRGLRRAGIEPLLVPLQHCVPADDALLVAALIGAPAVHSG